MYSESTKEIAIDMCLAGIPLGKISEKLGPDRMTIRFWYLQRYPEKKGPPRKRKVSPPGKWHSFETIEKAWKMKSQGNKYEYISAILNVPVPTLCDWFTFRARKRKNIIEARKYGFLKEGMQ